MSTPITLEALQAKVGQSLGQSDWYLLDQNRINQFADVTEDHQFIHVDPVRAKAETPFGGTIAHGFLTLSLLAPMCQALRPVLQGSKATLNYGFDKIRFLTPVPSGSRIRGTAILSGVDLRKPTEVLVKFAITVEIENLPKPALVADWMTMYVLG